MNTATKSGENIPCSVPIQAATRQPATLILCPSRAEANLEDPRSPITGYTKRANGRLERRAGAGTHVAVTRLFSCGRLARFGAEPTQRLVTAVHLDATRISQVVVATATGLPCQGRLKRTGLPDCTTQTIQADDGLPPKPTGCLGPTVRVTTALPPLCTSPKISTAPSS